MTFLSWFALPHMRLGSGLHVCLQGNYRSALEKSHVNSFCGSIQICKKHKAYLCLGVKIFANVRNGILMIFSLRADLDLRVAF